MRNCQPGAYYAGAGRRVAEADLRHISVSDHPTTDIRETCTYPLTRSPIKNIHSLRFVAHNFLGIKPHYDRYESRKKRVAKNISNTSSDAVISRRTENSKSDCAAFSFELYMHPSMEVNVILEAHHYEIRIECTPSGVEGPAGH